ncbi:saccharopine dehydrogenase [Neptunitalea chrysea]|uniref:Saccharopine dehydrogenase n=1 Tax=Neptunitalea chrysea TaxID=1647581 RepID=A0A9W6EUJ6_9FLAO|nr:saccharopine dehydrogenase C-terminal domain-containing protein [Neptunitalea chrysea]GLB51412.1 saccharopine dehydrogenase [Neptunitalea chrysea]
MRSIVVFGAGKSTAFLFDYFLNIAAKEALEITIVDKCFHAVSPEIKESTFFKLKTVDINNKEEVAKLIEYSSIVVSMLPAFLHIKIAKLCLTFKKNLVTASYISEEMKKMHMEVKGSGLIFLNEVGLDPGIDHMSAMKIIDDVTDKGGKLLLFESFCGGLLAPESDSNLWNYKFTWNPRNVVLAGQGGAAKFIQEGTYKYIPYHKLFRRTEFLNIEGYGGFEAYANRDSLKYRSIYGLDDILTFYRGTIRRVGFSRAWNMFVQLGMTDDSYVIEDSEHMSYRDFLNLFLAYSPSDSVELKLRHYLKIDQDDVMWQKLEELDLFSATKKIGVPNATPAQMLQRILENSWSLQENDKDMIVMYHKIGYELQGEKQQIDAHMVVTGTNSAYTAMAKTVGLPLGIATLLILNNKVTEKGVLLPLTKEIYEPILNELSALGITFRHEKVSYMGYNPNNVFG